MAKQLIEALRRRFPDEVLDSHDRHGDETVVIRRDRIVEIFEYLKTSGETDLNMLLDVTAVDYLSANQHGDVNHKSLTGHGKRFEVVYHLLSLARGQRLRIKVPLDASDLKLDSVVGVYTSADWFEREAFDMYGVRFEGHPKLKRILLYDEFEGHPLRKDYPIDKRQPLIPMKNADA